MKSEQIALLRLTQNFSFRRPKSADAAPLRKARAPRNRRRDADIECRSADRAPGDRARDQWLYCEAGRAGKALRTVSPARPAGLTSRRPLRQEALPRADSFTSAPVQRRHRAWPASRDRAAPAR